MNYEIEMKVNKKHIEGTPEIFIKQQLTEIPKNPRDVQEQLGWKRT